MPIYLAVEKPFGRAALPPVMLAAERYTDAESQFTERFGNPTFETAILYRMDDSGAIESAKVLSRAALGKKADELCVHCGEAIERRDGEVVSKYGNDPQCDASPSDSHRFA